MKLRLLAGYLEKSNPRVVASLRKTYPEASHLLSSAMEFGPSEKVDIPAQGLDRAAGFALVIATATQLKIDIDDLISLMKKRMQIVHKIRFVGTMVATITGAISAALALLGKYQGLSSEEIALLVAVITMFGGLLSLFADRFERTPTGVKFAGVEELTALVDLRGKVEKATIQVRQDAVIQCTDADITAAVTLMNDTTLKVMRFKYLSNS